MIPHSRPTLNKNDARIISDVIETGNIAEGEQVSKFEDECAHYTGRKGGAAVNSGTSALHLALLALDAGSGDEVAMPAYVCTALLNAVRYIGGTPVLIDINPESFNIDPYDLKRKITKKTKVVIVPHMFGLPADMDTILSFDIPVIEDCAQSIGAKYKGKRIGSFGAVSIFSFYATKVITSGEGGMILTDSENILKKIKRLREYDKQDSYMVCFNYKMTDIQASLGRSQLKKIDTFIERRKAIAERYLKSFSNMPVELPKYIDDRKHIYYRFVIKAQKETDEYIKLLKCKKIACERPVFYPLHKYFKHFSLPDTDRVWEKAISIPLYPSLTDTDVEKIIHVVMEVFAGQ